jgi:outer membrane protein assembly factor BamB
MRAALLLSAALIVGAPSPSPAVSPPAADAVPWGGPTSALPTDPLFGILWRRQLVEAQLLEFKPIEPAGPGVDPVTGLVVVAARDGKVEAFNPDGTPVWYFQGRGPYVAAPGFAGDLVLVGGSDGRLVALDRAKGTIRWKLEYREEMGSTPLTVGDLTYVATLQGTVLALDSKTGAWQWHFRREPVGKFSILGVGQPAVSDGVLYQGFPDGSVVALDAKSGTLKWERRVGRGEYPDIDASVQVGKGQIYVASYGGPVAALEAASGKQVWEVRVPYAYKARLEGDTLYVVTTTSVVALSARDGKERWTTPLEGTPFGDPIYVKGMLAVPNGKGLLLLDTRNGKRLRLFTRGSGATGSPAVLGKRVYVLSNVGELSAAELR